MSRDLETKAHREWLGYLQPMGLVVSPPALAEVLAFPNANIIPEHNRFLECVADVSVAGKDEKVAAITDFPRFCSHVLGWRPSDLVGSKEGGPLPDTLESVLTEYHETLRPTFAVKHPESKSQSQSPWMLLVKVLPDGTPFDDFIESDSHHWQVSPQARFERLPSARSPHITGADRSPVQRHKLASGLRAQGRGARAAFTFPVRAMTGSGRSAHLRGRARHAARRGPPVSTLPDGQRPPGDSPRRAGSTRRPGAPQGLHEQVLAAAL